MHHPSLDRLLLAGAGAGEIRRHLAECKLCRTLIELTQQSRPQLDVRVDPSRYQILGAIASGGMGRTSRAIDLRLGRVVALKELKHANPAWTARFEREARLTARLQHPAIVAIYEAGRWSDPGGPQDGEPFYAMRFVEGTTLADEISRRERLADRIALLPSVVSIVEAVAYAHLQGVIHRDIKPHNILVGPFGETILIDWGLAKDASARDETNPIAGEVLTETAGPTPTQMGVGTPHYMCPQQADGDAPDPRFDVYALGATLYELLSGAPPYGEGQSDAIRRKLLAGPPAAVAAVASAAPRELLAIVGKAMARDPAQRFQTAKELAEELQRFTAGRLVRTHRYSAGEMIGRWLRRPVVRAAALALLALGCVSAVLGAQTLRESLRAEETLALQFEEQGRQELIAGLPSRALVYLNEAYQRGVDSPALRLLLHAASRPFNSLLFELPGSNAITAVAFSGDSRLLAAADADGRLILWDARRGRRLATLADHLDQIQTVRFSGDGSRLVSTGRDGLVKIWTVPDGTLLRTLDGHRCPVIDAVFTAGGGVVSLGMDFTARVWDAETGAFRTCVPASARRPIFASISSDGSTLYTADGREGAVYSLPGCKLEARWPSGEAGGVPAALDPVRRRIAWSRDTRLFVVDYGAHPAASRDMGGHSDQILAVSLAVDGSLVASAGADGTAKVWDAGRGELIATMSGHDGQVRRVDFSPDGRLLATAGSDHTARLWDAGTGQLLATLEGHSELLEAARFSPDGHLLATGSLDGSVRLWDVEKASPVRSLERHQGVLRSVASDPDGALLVTAGGDGRIVVGEVAGTGSRVVLDSGRLRPALSACFGPGGRTIIGAGFDGTVGLWKTEDASPLGLVQHGTGLRAVSLDPEGDKFLTVGDGGRALLWTVGSSQPILLSGHGDTVVSAAFSADGRLAATASHDRTARVWESATGRLVMTAAHRGTVRSAVFSPDGSHLLTASDDGTARLTALPPGRDATLQHGGPIANAAFSPDGRIVLSAGADGTVKLWRAGNGSLIRSLSNDGVPVTSASFSPDGSLVLSTSDRMVILWDVERGSRLGALRMRGEGMTSAIFAGTGTSVVVGAGSEGRAIIWDAEIDGRSRKQVSAFVAAHARWRFSDGVLVPATPHRMAPEPEAAPERQDCHADQGKTCFQVAVGLKEGRERPRSDRGAMALFEAACRAGHVGGCVRSLEREHILDILPVGPTIYVLYIESVASAPIFFTRNGGYIIGGTAHLARIGEHSFTSTALEDEPQPYQEGHGALGIDSSGSILSFLLLRRRSDVWAVDGLLYKARFSESRTPAVQRELLFSEWNAGWHPWFDGDVLHHFAYSGRWLVEGTRRVRQASPRVARREELEHKFRRLGVVGAGIPNDDIPELPAPTVRAALSEWLVANAPPRRHAANSPRTP